MTAAGRLYGDLSPAAWDAALARLGGHPLQSSAWGNMRLTQDGIESIYLALEVAGEPDWLARFEIRKLPGYGRIAWCPRGPTRLEGAGAEALPEVVVDRLREARVDIVVSDCWLPVETAGCEPRTGQTRTIWLDLTLGELGLWGKLHTQIRNRVRKSKQAGVTTRPAESKADVEQFVDVCRGIEKMKNFDARVSSTAVTSLLENAVATAPVECALLLSVLGGQVCAGTFVFRVGRSMSMIWAASDRNYTMQRVGEAAHWAAIQWGLNRGCVLYDLEGIDPIRNPGVYRLKSHLGGREVTLCGREFHPISIAGRVLLPVVTHLVNRR